jgi:hypothetical protein
VELAFPGDDKPSGRCECLREARGTGRRPDPRRTRDTCWRRRARWTAENASSPEREELRLQARLIHVSVNTYDMERLVHLLRVLRPAPHGWLARAQQIALGTSVLTDGDLAALERALESDPVFRQRFDSDPVAAAEERGMRALASGLKREMRELVALAERVANDAGFRSELDEDPLAALAAVGMPSATAEPLLQALGVQDDVLAKLPEVVAHRYEAVTRRERLLLLLLGTTAVVDGLRPEPRGR